MYPVCRLAWTGRKIALFLRGKEISGVIDNTLEIQ